MLTHLTNVPAMRSGRRSTGWMTQDQGQMEKQEEEGGQGEVREHVQPHKAKKTISKCNL